MRDHGPWPGPGTPPEVPPMPPPGLPPQPPRWIPPEEPPRPTTRLPVVVEPLATTLEERLLARRIVAVTGPLDAATVTDLAARILHLDALGAEPVTVRLDSAGGDVEAALVLVDTFGALRAPVHVVVVGQAVAAAAVVVAAADEASIYPHARIVLAEPELPPVAGDATHLEAEAAERRRLLDAAYDVLARRCGRPREEVAQDARRRRVLTAEEAVGYGLVDRVERAGHGPRRAG